jgi:formylglycine-generating enzyme required for sulfatase activity
MRYLSKLLAIMLLLMGVSREKQVADVPIRPGKDYALFFAVSDYSNAGPNFGTLKNPIKDAKDIERELREIFGFETMVYENPTREVIEKVMEQWQEKAKQLAPDAQLFIFFSGHGTFRELNKKGYFIPYLKPGTKPDFPAYLDLTDIGNMASAIPCNHTLLAIDACYSGTLDAEIAFRGEQFKRPGTGGMAERERIVSQQLRNPSRLLLTSGGKERTPDGTTNSPFSSAILKGLRNAYTFGDGLLTYADLLAQMDRVSPKPHIGELPGHEAGGFVFISASLQIKSTITPEPTRPATLSAEPTTSVLDADLRQYNMVRIKGGTFTMGCTSEQGSDCDSDEQPVHQVTVSDFYIGRYEVTQKEWREVMGSDPPELAFKGCDNCPVERVSWEDIQQFLLKLNAKTGKAYRLPTEAEWEYAARGGSSSRGFKYAGSNTIDEVAWYTSNSGDKTRPVGQKKANELGLYDMSGNVWEWCQDWKGDYSSSAQTNPKGPSTGSGRVIRGGSWIDLPQICRVASRLYYTPGFRYGYIGFRLSRTL